MKKIILTLLVCLISFAGKSQSRKFWVDVQFIQNIGLNDWYDDKELNDRLSKPSTSDIRGSINWNFYKGLGLFFDMSLVINSYPDDNDFTIEDYPIINTDNFYLKKAWLRNERYNPGIKFSIGAFYKIERNRWSFIPYVGVGVQDADSPLYTAEIKEKNSNNLYELEYEWFRNNDNVTTSLGFLNTRLNFAYKLGKHSNLLFGIEYNRYLSRSEFSAKAVDHYTKAIINETETNGKYMNTLGISIGFSFR